PAVRDLLVTQLLHRDPQGHPRIGADRRRLRVPHLPQADPAARPAGDRVARDLPVPVDVERPARGADLRPRYPADYGRDPVAAVRSANRAARVAEESRLAGLRPLLVSSRREDPAQKIYFADREYVVAAGGQAGVQLTDEAVYFGISLRNAGSGIAVLHGWTMITGEIRVLDHRPTEEFTRLTRDLFVAPGDLGYWQGSFRDSSSDGFAAA